MISAALHWSVIWKTYWQCEKCNEHHDTAYTEPQSIALCNPSRYDTACYSSVSPAISPMLLLPVGQNSEYRITVLTVRLMILSTVCNNSPNSQGRKGIYFYLFFYSQIFTMRVIHLINPWISSCCFMLKLEATVGVILECTKWITSI